MIRLGGRCAPCFSTAVRGRGVRGLSIIEQGGRSAVSCRRRTPPDGRNCPDLTDQRNSVVQIGASPSCMSSDLRLEIGWEEWQERSEILRIRTKWYHFVPLS